MTNDVNDTNAANTGEVLSEAEIASKIAYVAVQNTEKGAAKGVIEYGEKLIKQRDAARDAPHLAKIKRLYDALKIAHDALVDVKGYGFKPKTYEIIKAALSETTPDNTKSKED